MKHPALPFALAAALAALAPAAPALAQAAASAQPSKAAREEAASRFNKGIELFQEQDYRAALVEFRRAHELVPSWAVLYNIGQVQYQLQDYAGALQTLERYLAEGGRQVPAARRAGVEKDIQKLKTRVGTLEVVINVPDAEVAIDELTIAKGPFTKPVLVSIGRHRITATREGYLPSTKVVDIASNDTAKVTFELNERGGASQPGAQEGPAPGAAPPDLGAAAQPGAPAAAPPPDGATPPPDGGRSIPWIGWGVTGGLAAGAVVFGVLALGASGDLQDLRAQEGVSADALSDASAKTTTFAVVTDVFAGAALVAGGVSLYLTLQSRGAPPEAAPAARAAPALRVGVVPGGMCVSGAF